MRLGFLVCATPMVKSLNRTPMIEAFAQLDQLIKAATALHVDHINDNSSYAIEFLSNQLFEDHDLFRKVFGANYAPSHEEKIILLLALAPHFAPQMLDIFMAKNPNFDRICTEFGGVIDNGHRGVIPTGETAMFLLTGRDQTLRSKVAKLFLPDHIFFRNNILELEDVADGSPWLSGKIMVDPEVIQLLTFGQVFPPKPSPTFPARQVQTNMEWDDLVIAEKTRKQLNELENWLNFNETLADYPELQKRTKKGYRALFYGPPGTGKTLTASLLGKSTNRPVFVIDLSMIVSKYIGETEKNLAQIFRKAENKKWILFFDEADALFGKRTQTESSNDKYANQEVAYLLQRIEAFNGLVILATNLKNNIDNAFIRRFQSIVEFASPTHTERELLWQQNLPAALPLTPEIDVKDLAKHYELTGAQISNILQNCFIETLSKKEDGISKDTLLAGIRREFMKEDKIFETL